MNPLEVTKFLIEMKHDAVRQIQQKVGTSKICDVTVVGIDMTPSNSISEIDEEIFLDMTLRMGIDCVTPKDIDELLREGSVEILAKSGRFSDIIYTTSYNYCSENGTEYESGFCGAG